MAIQHRRGEYANFDPTKMKPGEYAVVQQGDPEAGNGKAVYIAFGAGDVKRMATMDELHSYDASARAAASSLPLHSTAIMDNTGRLIERQNFEMMAEELIEENTVEVAS